MGKSKMTIKKFASKLHLVILSDEVTVRSGSESGLRLLKMTRSAYNEHYRDNRLNRLRMIKSLYKTYCL